MNKRKKKDSPIQCVNCGQRTAYVARRDEIFGRGPDAVIIENIPFIECRSCGINYFTPETSHAIDEICAHPKKYAMKQYRAVAQLA
jgi:YgiT-type zinc finger domain-containing protein